jgi:hypothetical protein
MFAVLKRQLGITAEDEFEVGEILKADRREREAKS